jgi:hypothetical protein
MSMPRTVRDLLDDHEADLISRLKALRDQIIPLERELAEVRRARSAVSMIDYGPEQTQILFPAKNGASEPEQGPARVSRDLTPPRSPYARLTIKQLVRKALSEQFERGATANELLDFFSDAWGRSDVLRTSLSPQLSRLKQEGAIILIGQKWSLPTAQNRNVEQAPSPEKAAISR